MTYSGDNTADRIRSRKTELIAICVFVVVNLFAPFLVGEMYPFTVSPMFRDQPSQYCTYELLDENGNQLELEPFGLHLVYDGNPPGLGMGIEAAPRLHGFGEVPEFDLVIEHVRSKASSMQLGCKNLRLCQTIVCCNGTCPEKTVQESVISVDGLSKNQADE
jgi:hypothetical protein